MNNIRITYILTLSVMVTFFGCKKCKEQAEKEYTFKGRFENGTTMLPTRANEKITVFTKTVKSNGNSNISEIGSFTTDAAARFEFKYKHQNNGTSITLIDAFQGRFDDLPLNQNFEKDPWYVSSYGKLKLKIDLSNYNYDSQDTLFIAYQSINGKPDEPKIEEVIGLKSINEVELRLIRKEQFIFMGIGHENFKVDANGRMKFYDKRTKVNITGDPFVDSLTYHYLE